MPNMHLEFQFQSINRANKRVGALCERVVVDLDELDETFDSQSDNPADQTDH